MTVGLGTVLIGGGSGFIGTALSMLLRSKGYNVVILSRMPQLGLGHISWNTLQSEGLPVNCTAVVNLAGQNFLDPMRRWTPDFKQNVVSSRINTTKSLASAIVKAKIKPKVFVCTSGVGYYPASTSNSYTEDTPIANGDFFTELCKEWEEAGKLPTELGVRHVIIRTGVVLGRAGGMINNLFVPFYMGLGGPVGSGKQFLPWIHIDDIARLFVFAIENDRVRGVINGVAPQIVTNKEFAKAFGRALWRPAVIPLPMFVVNLIFGEERGSVLGQGQKVIPKKAMELGFKYQYEDIYSACKTCTRLIYADDNQFRQ